MLLALKILATIAIVLWVLWFLLIVWGPDVVSALIRRAKRTPYYHLTGYMNRWWLVPYRYPVARWTAGTVHLDGTGAARFTRRPIAWLFQRFNISVRVHEILRGDLDRHPHDHPFNYLTIILRGVYWETRYDNAGKVISTKMHRPGSIMWRPVGSWHLLDLPQGPVTTLFFTGRKLNGVWGFNVEGVKMARREYEKIHGRPW